MILRLQGTYLDFSDDFYPFVTDNPTNAFRAFGALDRDSVKVDVELEETTRRRP